MEGSTIDRQRASGNVTVFHLEFVMRAVRMIALVAFLPFPSYAAGGGVFCKDTMSFIARPEASGALAFKVMGSTQQKNIIELGGIALPHAGGWRYQMKSTSTPEYRCTLDIKATAGGFHLSTVRGAECVSSGGIGASALIGDASFPASSRIPNIVPPNGKPDDFPEVDCRHKKFFSANELVIACAAQTPESVVRGLVAQDTGGWGKIFAERPTAIMRHYFTDGFNASWTNAVGHNQNEPVLDGDPITGMQTVTRVQVLSTSGGGIGPATAKVVARLKVTFGGTVQTEQVSFDLKLENQRWKIDDIISGPMQSIRSYFRNLHKS